MNETEEFDYRLLSLLTAEQAHRFSVVPMRKDGSKLFLAASESHTRTRKQLQLILGSDLQLEVVSQDKLQKLLHTHYPFEKAQNSHTPDQAEAGDVVRFVNKVFQEAAAMGASDIHIERYESEARIRFRWEGVLVEKYEVALDQYNAIVSRIKILADLDISERRLPQDGRINLTLAGKTIDIRVSTVPGKYGEKVVLRLLTRSQSHLQLKNLGMGANDEKAYLEAIRKPNGIILITGPTGSGKTTTLYATLNLLNSPEKNIMTIEDPIEYNLSGINQIQLKEEIGLSFDRALRAFLRQDPDIIMVGEIRDQATAQIAIRAALTGHLVFSTLHTNSAWDAVTRLTDMGVEPYLLASALSLVVSQRLVRLLCPHCKQESQERLMPELQDKYQINTHWVPVGCPRCYYTGYLGRQAVFEVLEMRRDEVRQIKSGKVASGKNEWEKNLISVIKKGYSSIFEIMSV